MLNPLASLVSPLMEPPYDEQIRLTWAKRDLAQGTLNAMHEIMQTSPLKSAGDQELFACVLTGYAGFMQYVEALGDQLTRLNGGQPVDEKALVASAPSWLSKDLMSSLQQQIQSEAAPFIAEWERSLSGIPTPSLQEAQHEGTVQRAARTRHELHAVARRARGKMPLPTSPLPGACFASSRVHSPLLPQSLILSDAIQCYTTLFKAYFPCPGGRSPRARE